VFLSRFESTSSCANSNTHVGASPHAKRIPFLVVVYVNSEITDGRGCLGRGGRVFTNTCLNRFSSSCAGLLLVSDAFRVAPVYLPSLIHRENKGNCQKSTLNATQGFLLFYYADPARLQTHTHRGI
jgi:hypothetical protein